MIERRGMAEQMKDEIKSELRTGIANEGWTREGTGMGILHYTI